MINISYTTDISKPYVDGINKCKSKIELEKFIIEYKEIAYDAFEQIHSKDFDWKEYQAGCKIERKGKYAGDEYASKYGSILLPEIILFVGIQAQHFHAPEGTVFIRFQDFKIIKKRKNGIYYLDLPKKK